MLLTDDGALQHHRGRAGGRPHRPGQLAVEPGRHVPVRPVVKVLAALVNVTVPAPVPLAPAVTVIQGALLTAVHAQPLPAVTLVLPAPPAVPTD